MPNFLILLQNTTVMTLALFTVVTTPQRHATTVANADASVICTLA